MLLAYRNRVTNCKSTIDSLCDICDVSSFLDGQRSLALTPSSPGWGGGGGMEAEKRSKNEAMCDIGDEGRTLFIIM